MFHDTSRKEFASYLRQNRVVIVENQRVFVLLIRSLILVLLAGGAVFLDPANAWADPPSGRVKQDITVGANHDVQLKAGQVVQILKQSGATVVIMVSLPDGSNGIFQIDATDVEMTVPNAAPPQPPAAPVATTPVITNAAPALAVAPTPAGPPTYPDGFVGGPEFHTTIGDQAAGTASVVKLKGGTQSYIISARHLLGPDGGFKTQTAAADVPAFVQSIQIEAFSGGSQHYDVTGLLVTANRLQATGGDPINDVAVYQNHDTTPQNQAVVLSDQLPAIGAPVWVVARVRGGVPEGQIMQSGKVTGNSRWLIFQFDNDGIIPAGASGAPVLNAAGEVVGVYSGHNNEKGHVLGFAVPSPLIVKVIKEAPPVAQ